MLVYLLLLFINGNTSLYLKPIACRASHDRLTRPVPSGSLLFLHLVASSIS